MSEIDVSSQTMNSITRLRLRNLRLPSYVSKILYVLEKGFGKYAIDAFIIDDVSHAIWIHTLEGLPEEKIIGTLNFGVLVDNWPSYKNLRDYLTSQNELTRSRIFYNERNTPYTLSYLPEPFTVNLIPIERHKRDEYDSLLEIYKGGLSVIEFDDQYTFKYQSLEGTIIQNVLSWDFEDQAEFALNSVNDLTHLLYCLFHCDWERNPSLFTLIQKSVDELVDKNQNTLLWDFTWWMDGARILGEKLSGIVNQDKSIKYKLMSNIDSCLKKDNIELLNRIGISFQVGSTSYVKMEGSEVSMMLRSLKNGVEI